MKHQKVSHVSAAAQHFAKRLLETAPSVPPTKKQVERGYILDPSIINRAHKEALKRMKPKP